MTPIDGDRDPLAGDPLAGDPLERQEAIQAAAEMQRASWGSPVDDDVVDAVIEDWIQVVARWLPTDAERSIQRFMSHGLSHDDLFHAMQVTASVPRSNYWRYFCGVAWNMLRDREEIAHEIVTGAQGGE